MRKWTSEQIKFLNNMSLSKSNEEITKLLNKKFNTNYTISAVKTKKQKLGIKSNYKYLPKYNDVVIEFIKKNYQGKDNIELANILNKKFNLNTTGDKISMLKANLKRRYGLDLRTGINRGYFKKGQEPMNKGLKWDEYLTVDQQQRSKKTWFKKGNISSNNVPIGTERINRDGYIEVKIRDGSLNKNWQLKHRLVYMQNYGEIPKGYNVIFLDGNKLNFNKDNLSLISDSELLLMNRKKLFVQNAEITRTAVTLVKCIDKTFKVKNARK